MKEIRLKSMEINNFKKIASSGVLDFSKNQIEIRGKNESGKSTIADAFFWCMFGKNSNDVKVFSIKPIAKNGEETHYLTTDVSVTLSIDGVDKKFKRTYYEKYASKRGSTEKYFDGNTSDYFINDVPIAKASDYQQTVNEVIDEELFKLLTSTTYFNSLHWTKQREIIFKLVQGISDLDIANMFEDLKDLAKELENKKVEDMKAQHLLIMKECDKKIKELPGEIKTLQEINYNLPENFNPGVNDSLLKIKTKKRDELLMTSPSKTKNLKAEEIEGTIGAIKLDINRAKNKKEAILMDAEHDKNMKIGELSAKAETMKKSISKFDEDTNVLVDRIAKGKDKVAEKMMEREKLIASFKEIKARVFTPKSDTCPTCGSKWPIEKIEEFEKHFNADIATALEKNKESGLQVKAEIEKYNSAIDGLLDQVKYLAVQKEEAISTLAAIEDEIKDLESKGFEADTKEIDSKLETYASRINLLEQELENAKGLTVAADSVDLAQQEIDDLATEIDLLSKYKINYANEVNCKESIILKEQEMKENLAKFEKSSKVMSLIDTFTERKANVLADRVNKPFKLVKFKLANKNDNGTVENTCIATVNGVPFPDVNTGAKIQAGLDIIGGLQEIYQVRMPIFIDNAEAVTHWMIEMESQMIKLYADAAYEAIEIL